MRSGRACIYEWRAWDGYLLPAVCDDPLRIPARIGESGADVLRRIPDGVGFLAFHVNLTHTARIPSARERMCHALRRRGIPVLNGRVTSISKHDVQQTCAAAGLLTSRADRGGDPDELLIVKTDWNYGGEMEARLTLGERRYLGLPDQDSWSPGHDGYRTLRRADVSGRCWTAPDVIVERFIANRLHVFYRCYAAGGNLVVSRVTDPAPLKKMPIGITRTSWFLELRTAACIQGPGAPPERVASAAARFCRVAGLEFGALDVVEDDAGRCYIVDVNTTPYWGAGGHPDLLRFLGDGVRRLAERAMASRLEECPEAGPASAHACDRR